MILVYLMWNVALVTAQATALSPDQKNGCQYAGKTFGVGETRQQDCDTCTCTADGNINYSHTSIYRAYQLPCPPITVPLHLPGLIITPKYRVYV